MPRLTLRTLLAYIDDTLEPTEARSLGRKVAESEEARELVERIKRVTRRRGLKTPVPTHADDETADPNTVAEYLDNTLDSGTLKQVEETCLGSDVHLAEVAACHQILTLVLTEPVRVPPRAHRRMYGLVPAPASAPNRRPNKALPVSVAGPPAHDRGEADDADAALLLGMKRYFSATSWGSRLALVGLGAALLVFLAGAVYMSLPHRSPQAPETTPGNSFTQLTPPAPELPAPKPKAPDAPPPKKPKDPDPVAKKPVEAEPNAVYGLALAVANEVRSTNLVDPGPGLGDPVAAPDAAVKDIGRVENARALVLAQDPKKPGEWVRLRAKPDEDPVFTNVPLMALPGYKANVLVGARDRQVQVLLWGNVPEQLGYRVFESRVTFHPPPAGFDADITLQAGRIYLQSKKLDGDKKPTGRMVRVRVAGEVWDITLPDEKSEVLVELVSWFDSTTGYARNDTKPPLQEARAAVVAGAAGFAAPRRFKVAQNIALNTERAWDSRTGKLTEPAPIQNLQNSAPTPAQDGDFQRMIMRLLSEAAEKVADRNVRQVMEGRLDPEPTVKDREFVARLAIYSQAALADSTPAGGKVLEPLVDVFKSELQPLPRQAVVTALTAWVARDRGNTTILRGVLVSKGVGEDTEQEDAADRVLRLLRGFVSPTKPDPDRLDELLKLLSDKAVPVREAALWNILAVEQDSWVPAPVGDVNVGAVGTAVNSEDYKKFLAISRTKIDALKKRVPVAPLPLPVPKKP